jgi:hypothetical protein
MAKINKRDSQINVAINNEIKILFSNECSKEFMTMSSKINQLITEYLKSKEMDRQLIVDRLNNYYK